MKQKTFKLAQIDKNIDCQKISLNKDYRLFYRVFTKAVRLKVDYLFFDYREDGHFCCFSKTEGDHQRELFIILDNKQILSTLELTFWSKSTKYKTINKLYISDQFELMAEL